MPMPLFSCPNCRASMSLDVVLADDAPRDALAAIIEVHPAGDSFVKPMLRYVGLFAPPKSQMSHSRMATLIRELAPLIRAAQFERNGRTWVCPIEYWRQGFEHMIVMRDDGRLNLPLKSHGYLFEVLAGLIDRVESRAESLTERQRQGHAGLGTPLARITPAQEIVPPPPRSEEERTVTPTVQDALGKMRALTKDMNSFFNTRK
ncbi:hypothetical protein [Paraburkholderia unamae]|uniref:Uncharacterized protein n=1 Tax=Paraburkholderia unamae TaxID=219649 RepID=A0ABX5KND0_9BURK|nr:hypothetical protein [Paraburkholderia unamae]PVX80028.1 hypothetical protein C7402_112215 [Paraburkholderia unamae]